MAVGESLEMVAEVEPSEKELAVVVAAAAGCWNLVLEQELVMKQDVTRVKVVVKLQALMEMPSWEFLLTTFSAKKAASNAVPKTNNNTYLKMC